MTRAPILNALFAQIAGTQTLPAGTWSKGWTTASQTLRLWKDVAASEHPAFFLAYRGDTAVPLGSGPVTKWQLHADAWIYVMHDDAGSPAMTQLAARIDAVESALAPAATQSQGRQTLGGLVYAAKIVGEIETDEGSLGDQAIAVVPITLVVSP